MHGSARIGLLLVAAALAACSSEQRYSVSKSPPTTSTYPGTSSYTPSTAYTPTPVAPVGATAVTFDLNRTDRQTAAAEAGRFCADQGRAAVFRSIDGYAITYDCVVTGGSYGTGTAAIPMTGLPSITYESIGVDPLTLQAEANQFCARQGLVAAYAGRDGDRVTYDCVNSTAAASVPSAAMSGSSMPVAVPSITYEIAGDNRTPAETAAIKYCAMQGLSPVLREQVGRRVTYDCR
jgi:hypothetical protein